VFGGSLEEMRETVDYGTILAVNVLIGISFALMIIELKWDAVRVLLTVVFALFLGYLVTLAFNADAANRYMQGEFTVRLISDAEAVEIENEEVDLEYGRQRGGTFDDEITDASFVFRGSADDRVTVVAFAANRRSEVDMQVALLDESGAILAEGTSIAAEIIEQDVYEDVRRETDALIETVTLPADGLYTLRAAPQPVTFSVALGESVSATNVAFDAFLLGPLSRPNRWAVWIQDALTLILVGLAIAVVFRARQFSLGAEGQLYFGALISGIIAINMPEVSRWLVIPLAILGSITAGFLWGLVPGALKAYLGANELVSTLMLNVIAIRFYELVLTYELKPSDAGYIASGEFPFSGQLPPILEGTQVTIAVYFVVAAVILSWLLIRRTPLGYEIRMIGSNIKFAEYGGVRTARNIMLVMAISGAIAGLAGSHLSMGIHRRLIVGISTGLAFEGVVVALLARNNVLVTPFTGLLYAYLRTGAQFMERDAGVSFEVVRIIQAVIILLITAEALVTMFRQRKPRQRGTQPLDGTNPTLETLTPSEEGAAHV
jgi:simple sugar transport system permease protein